jgi:hypothetical protein
VTGVVEGLIGLGANLPVPGWLPAVPLDVLTPQALRRLAPAITDIAPATGWHRLLGPADLAASIPGSKAGRRPGHCYAIAQRDGPRRKPHSDGGKSG